MDKSRVSCVFPTYREPPTYPLEEHAEQPSFGAWRRAPSSSLAGHHSRCTSKRNSERWDERDGNKQRRFVACWGPSLPTCALFLACTIYWLDDSSVNGDGPSGCQAVGVLQLAAISWFVRDVFHGGVVRKSLTLPWRVGATYAAYPLSFDCLSRHLLSHTEGTKSHMRPPQITETVATV